MIFIRSSFIIFWIIIVLMFQSRLIRISPFANRLSDDGPSNVQRLRCLSNYEALRFSNPISTFAESLVSRMRRRGMNDSGKYIAVHLRFEEVCCTGTSSDLTSTKFSFSSSF